MAHLLSGKKVSESIMTELKHTLSKLSQHTHKTPSLTVIQVGKDPASHVYVKNKQLACEKVGILSNKIELDEKTTEEKLINIVEEINVDTDVSGLIVQLPLPNHIDENKVLDTISPDKDVDGFHPENLGKLAQKRPMIRSCTPQGIMELLAHYKLSITGKNVVIIGASNIVGRPMLLEALNVGATVTCCHSKTKNLKSHCKNADVVIIATGKRNLLNKNDFNPDAIVIDVGIHRLENGRLCGDLDFDEVSPVVAHMTPVPGGVGPLTVACLLKNTVDAFIRQNHLA